MEMVSKALATSVWSTEVQLFVRGIGAPFAHIVYFFPHVQQRLYCLAFLVARP